MIELLGVALPQGTHLIRQQLERNDSRGFKPRGTKSVLGSGNHVQQLKVKNMGNLNKMSIKLNHIPRRSE